jgi:hypothetical protein
LRIERERGRGENPKTKLALEGFAKGQWNWERQMKGLLQRNLQMSEGERLGFLRSAFLGRRRSLG